MERKTYKDIDEYIDSFPVAQQAVLRQIRMLITQAAPMATEAISWDMPTFKYEGIVVQFGGFTRHASLFPGPEAIEAFNAELSGYHISKGTIQLPYDQPLPTDLIERIVKFRIERNQDKAAIKAAAKQKAK